MGRFDATGPVEVRSLQHSVCELPWGVVGGALGPSDGSAGLHSNVPSALAVMRHAPLYASAPEEIEEAFFVLENHVMRGERLYPVAVTVLPFLFEMVRRGSALGERITDLIAKYAARATALEPHHVQLKLIIADHELEIVGWLGRYDRAAAALAIHVVALRAAFLAAIARSSRLAPSVLVALIDLGSAPGKSIEIAMQILDRETMSSHARMAAAAFLARYGEQTPDLRSRIDAALPPSAPAAIERYVGELWKPTVERPVVAPQLHEAEVVFVGEKLVLVRTGSRSVTLPWSGATMKRGDKLKIGITAHGQPKLAFVTDGEGRVIVVDF